MKRTGLQRLSCEQGCAAAVYQTVAAIERGPLPRCGECGARFIPDRMELAAVAGVELDAHPEHVEYVRHLSGVLHGQAAHAQRGRALRQPEEIAAARVESDRAARAVAARLAALAAHRPNQSEPIPF